jgi:hypothetical protein
VIPCDARLFYTFDGEGTIVADGEEHAMKKGSLLLINAGIEYTVKSPEAHVSYIALNFDYSFSDSNVFLKDREEFFSKAAQSEEIYRNYLAKNGKAIAEEKINSEISEVFGENTVAKLGSDGLVVSGADASSKNDITEYVKKHYGIAVTYED